MQLTYNEFEILVNIEDNQDKKLSQREIGNNVNLSVGTVNKVIKDLLVNDIIIVNNNQIMKVTDKGYDILEKYRVKRALFLAAGFGSRMVPLTFNTPKPLIRVHGKRMIETLLDAVVEKGINEIYIVRGYLGEQFEALLHKYPQIKLINNDMYNEANNISSAYMIKDLMENAYVLESDLVLSNPNLIRKYEYSSNFLGIKVKRTDDWCFETKNGLIIKQKIGGENCHQMIGISYFTKEDGKKLSLDIEKVYNSPGGKEKYWDQVPLVEKKDNYKIYVRECNKEDIIEIDSFKELKEIDSTYNV